MTNWILVPVHNCVGYTKVAVKSFLRQDVGDVRVLLIDNESDDGTNEWSRSQHPKVVTVRKSPGLSVTASWNLGLSMLFQQTDKVLVVNNDVELRADLYRHLATDGGGFVTAVGVLKREMMYPEKRFECTEQGEPRVLVVDREKRRPHPDFSCFLIRREVWEKVGRFDEAMAYYCQDGDYHLRMHQLGVEAYCLDVPYLHHISGTLNNANDAYRDAVCKKADADRFAFNAKWGCEMGSPKYYEMFTHSKSGSPA